MHRALNKSTIQLREMLRALLYVSVWGWHRRLIALRRSDAALREGRTVMLDPTNPGVLTYARVAPDGKAVLVSLNMSPQPQTVALGLENAGVRGSRLQTLLSSPLPMGNVGTREPVTLPPFAAWVAAIE